MAISADRREQHCMDYIRQLIMCRADMTVEWAAPYPDTLGNKDHIDGYGVPHTCTKWVSGWSRACEKRINGLLTIIQDDMYEYMIENRPRRHQQHRH